MVAQISVALFTGCPFFVAVFSVALFSVAVFTVCPPPRHGAHTLRKKWVICMSAVCFRYSTFKRKSRFSDRVGVRVTKSLVETDGAICTDLPLVLYISL